MSSARALGGGSAAIVAPAAEVYTRTWADTLAVHVEYARECDRARAERSRGEDRLADLRMKGAQKMLDTHERHLRAQHEAETARAWIDRARREAGL